MGASVLISVGGSDGLPFALIFGACISYFYKYLWNIGKDQYNTFKGEADDDASEETK
jgi:hypothetical protein